MKELAMVDVVSLCPRCFRPDTLLEPYQSFQDSVRMGRINITRNRADTAYYCHGCRAEFDAPIKIRACDGTKHDAK